MAVAALAKSPRLTLIDLGTRKIKVRAVSAIAARSFGRSIQFSVLS
jgi:hypothetical protein